MSAVQLRPTFLLESELSSEHVVQRIRDSFSNHPDVTTPGPYQGRFTGRHAMISIVESKRHFWSPWMHLEIRNDSQRRMVAGRFSPHPSIWTGFIFSFLGIGSLVFFAALFGISQQLSGQSPWAYVFIPIGLSIIALLWFISKTGQKLAHEEMEQMKSRIEECLAD